MQLRNKSLGILPILVLAHVGGTLQRPTSSLGQDSTRLVIESEQIIISSSELPDPTVTGSNLAATRHQIDETFSYDHEIQSTTSEIARGPQNLDENRVPSIQPSASNSGVDVTCNDLREAAEASVIPIDIDAKNVDGAMDWSRTGAFSRRF